MAKKFSLRKGGGAPTPPPPPPPPPDHPGPICHRDKQPCIGPRCTLFIPDESEPNAGDCAEVAAADQQAAFYSTLLDGIETLKEHPEILLHLAQGLTGGAKPTPEPEESEEPEVQKIDV